MPGSVLSASPNSLIVPVHNQVYGGIDIRLRTQNQPENETYLKLARNVRFWNMTAIAVVPKKTFVTLSGDTTVFVPKADTGAAVVTVPPVLSDVFTPTPAECLCVDTPFDEQAVQLHVPPLDANVPSPLVVPGTQSFDVVPGVPPVL